jgi:peptidyl-prolyl cis-trans isomerase A (cyclophilin A)
MFSRRFCEARPEKRNAMMHVLDLGRSAATCLLIALSVSTAGATIVRFDTSAGPIDVRLYDSATPLSVANFLNYATTDRYDGTFIHRSPETDSGAEKFVIQGGGFLLNNSIFAAAPIDADDPVLNEPGISNIRGTLAYAKGSDPDSATCQWFFSMKDNSFLDSPSYGAFTVFGRVVGDGMTVADAIANLELIDASVAQDQPGEDYDEIPVFDVEKVIAQQDIRNDDAVIINSIDELLLPAGDYNFDGAVNVADYNLWKSTFGSITNAEADGNGNGIVDAADYTVWRESLATISGDYDGNLVVNEADYQKWRADFGVTVAVGTGADGNGDGIVDAADYTVWRDSLLVGGGASLSTVTVPEPAALVLLLVGLACGAFGVCRREA